MLDMAEINELLSASEAEVVCELEDKNMDFNNTYSLDEVISLLDKG